MPSISAVIITYNEERKIARCIESVKKVADEVVVVDSYSTDRTREIAVALGARVVQHTFEGFTAQKNFAMEQASHDYVLSLDADEYLSLALEQSMQNVKNAWTADAYDFNRLNSYAGKWIKSCGWYPDRKIRLWDRRKGRWQGELVHEVVVMQAGARTVTLAGDLLHEAYQNAAQLIKKMQGQYADLFAEQHAFKKKVTAFKIFYKTFASFFKSYITSGGIADGYEGLVISVSNANGTFYKYAKLLERNRTARTSLVVLADGSIEALLEKITGWTTWPEEVVVVGKGSDQLSVDALIVKLPVPVKFVPASSNVEAAKNAIAAATQEYVVLSEGNPSAQAFVAHRKAAWKGRAIRHDRVLSFWRSDVEGSAIDAQHSVDHQLKTKGIAVVGL